MEASKKIGLPRRMRAVSLVLVAAACCALLVPQLPAGAAVPRMSVPSDQLTGLRLLNADRATNHRRALLLRSDLQKKAQAWANHLATPGAPFAHSHLATGITGCWTILGENIAANYSLVGAEHSFMGSPPHRADILNVLFSFSAVGVAWTPDGRVFVVQEFARGC